MKVWLIILIAFYATFLIKNAESVGENGERPKINKTFDEIFGKGWDAEVPEFTETKEWHKMETQTTEVENKSTDQPNPNEQSFSDHFESFANRKIKERFDEMFDENWSEDDNEFNEEDEADSTDQNDCIDGQKDPGPKLIKRRKNDYSEQQKREIVEEFLKMNDEYKQKGKHAKKEWNKIYAKISMSVGVGHNKIKKWKKEIGLSQKLHSKQEKREKLKQYCEIKKSNTKIKDFEIAKILNIGKRTLIQWKKEFKNDVKDVNDFSLQNEFSQLKVYSDQQKLEIVQKFREIKDGYRQNKNTKEWIKSENKIANSLGVNRTKLYKWIKELGLTQEKFPEFEKREILKQFDEIKSKCKKEKLKNSSIYKLDERIAKKLGVCRKTIYEWKRKFGLSVSNKISDATKIGILKKYAKIKENNPKMSDCDIVDLLKISISSLIKWKVQFKEEIKNL